MPYQYSHSDYRLLRTVEVPKLARLIGLLPTRPAEVWQRLTTMLEVRAESYRRRPSMIEPVEWSKAICDLSRLWQVDLDTLLREPEMEIVEQQVFRLMQTMPKDAPFGSFHNGDFGMARLCYALARVIQPRAIVETGVCYGVTSAFLLKALQVNGGGVLHSIDLPPLGKDADQFVGRFIPCELRSSWKLYRGSSKSLLSMVLKDVGKVGLFVHDSLHTRRNMMREFETVTPYLSCKAAVIADDIEGNDAFHAWAGKIRPQYSAALPEQSKQSLFGVAVFCSNSPLSP
jgi:methyltransferase family protein